MPDKTTIDTLLLHFPDGRITGGGVAIRCRCGHESWAQSDEVHGPISAENNTWLIAERRHAEHALDAAPTTDPPHDIDWQEVAERHEDTIKALVTERDEARHDRGGVRIALGRAMERAEKAEQARSEMERLVGHAEGELADVRADLASWLNATPRELLDAVWEAAYVPEDGIIPKGSEYITRFRNETVTGPYVAWEDHASAAPDGERRLLDPPTPKRPDGAETFDPIVDAAIRGHSEITAPDVVHAISDALAEEGVRAPERGGR